MLQHELLSLPQFAVGRYLANMFSDIKIQIILLTVKSGTNEIAISNNSSLISSDKLYVLIDTFQIAKYVLHTDIQV